MVHPPWHSLAKYLGLTCIYSLIPRTLYWEPDCTGQLLFSSSLVPRPSITANVVEGLVNSYVECYGGMAYRAMHALALPFTGSAMLRTST